MTRNTPRRQAASAAWCNRILILSLLGIAYLTFFPFRLHPGAFQAIRGNPFLLGNSGKEYFTRDFFLNVLLFVPFGFGISAQIFKRNGGLLRAFLWSLALGALASYSVEFMQLYIPERDSGWEDVFSNTTGSVAGFVLFVLVGESLLVAVSAWEDRIAVWFTPRRTAALLIAYFAAGFGVNAYLQNQTRLSNWDPRCALYVGNDASGRAPWQGKVFALQIWNRALPGSTVRGLAAHESPPDENAGLLARYDFQSLGSFPDEGNLLPALEWTPRQPQSALAGPPELGRKAWLSTKTPAENLTRAIQRTSKFTVRVICEPQSIEGATGRIVSLSESVDNVNFHFRQYGEELVFYFRNPLTETRSILAWGIPHVFQAEKVTDIVAVYDGVDAFLYVDGVAVPRDYQLGPGAVLFHAVSFVQAVDLQGAAVVYYTLLFLPAGALAGLGLRNWRTRGSAAVWLAILGWILPALLCEALLVLQTGRRIWWGNVAMALFFGLAGILLINADGTNPQMNTDSHR